MEHSGPSSDIMCEILSRLSLKTMASCRLLSKECNNLSYEPGFMGLHCQRTSTIAGYFTQILHNGYYDSTFVSADNLNPSSCNNKLRLDFLPRHLDSLKIIGCADGGLMLLLAHNPTEGKKYYICKPSTKEFETIIPNYTPRRFIMQTGFIILGLNPLQFKIVLIFQREHDDDDDDWWDSWNPDFYYYGCQVFNSDTWTWKRLKDLSLPPCEFPNQNQAALSASGGLHWLTSSEENILSFYEDKERWELVPLPEPEIISTKDLSSVHIRLTKYEGKLGEVYYDHRTQIVELWKKVTDKRFGERHKWWTCQAVTKK